MALTELQIRQAKPKDKRYMIRDDYGLYLEVMSSGSKFWRMRYWEGKKETKLTLGEYPFISLSEARERRNDLMKSKAHGIDPKTQLNPTVIESATFEKVGREWYSKHIDGIRSKSHAETVIYRLERFLFPSLGHLNLKEIIAPILLSVLRTIEERGTAETAHRVKQIAGQIFRYGIAIGECEHDISADLRGALTPVISKHHSSFTDTKDIAGLVRAMVGFNGSFIVKCALWFSAYTFARPGEVRHAEWTEINIESREWKIPAQKMKKRKTHIVPLSRQVLEIINRIQPWTGTGKYVFPSNRTLNHGERPMSENTITAALRRLGYTGDEMTPHGFRSMASTTLNEKGWHPDVIERQLAHVEGNSVRAAYNYAEYLPERRKMMQEWADWLDSLKSNN